jgi:hypothetical protein
MHLKGFSMVFVQKEEGEATGPQGRPKWRRPGKGQRVRWGSGFVPRSNLGRVKIERFGEVVEESRIHNAGPRKSSQGGQAAKV